MGLGINVITSNQASKLVQDSAFQVLSEGSLKAVARPAFTLMDKSASPEARKYSATKELIFQSASMAMYFAIITTVFQRGGYKFLKKLPKFKKYDALNGINITRTPTQARWFVLSSTSQSLRKSLIKDKITAEPIGSAVILLFKD